MTRLHFVFYINVVMDTKETVVFWVIKRHIKYTLIRHLQKRVKVSPLCMHLSTVKMHALSNYRRILVCPSR